MHNASDHIETEERNASFRTSAGVPLSWSLTATSQAPEWREY